MSRPASRRRPRQSRDDYAGARMEGVDAGPSGYEAYHMVAEELGDPQTTLDDLEPAVVRVAKAYAQRAHKAWPPRPPRPTMWVGGF